MRGQADGGARLDFLEDFHLFLDRFLSDCVGFGKNDDACESELLGKHVRRLAQGWIQSGRGIP